MRAGLGFLLLAGLGLAHTPCRADPACAAFDSKTLLFAGSPQQQASCLVRAVHEWGRLERRPQQLPGPLAALVGARVDVSAAAYRRFLTAQGIAERDIGGALDAPLSRGNSNAADAPEAGYFVIHDTSTPNLGGQAFSALINSKGWAFNRLKSYMRGKPTVAPGCVKSADPGSQPDAHVFINRLGASVAPVDFAIPWRATKFESQNDCRAKGLFLHVELVQPRRTDRQAGRSNDALGPVPGFTEAQYRRLAIVYVAASVRKGSWLVPVFHATLDEGISDGHDDPQNFVLSQWSAALGRLLQDINAQTVAVSGR